jgi:hypothetical protein
MGGSEEFKWEILKKIKSERGLGALGRIGSLRKGNQKLTCKFSPFGFISDSTALIYYFIFTWTTAIIL